MHAALLIVLLLFPVLCAGQYEWKPWKIGVGNDEDSSYSNSIKLAPFTNHVPYYAIPGIPAAPPPPVYFAPPPPPVYVAPSPPPPPYSWSDSSTSNARRVSNAYAGSPIEQWVATKLGDEMNGMRDDLLSRKDAGEGFIERHIGAWTTLDNWKWDPAAQQRQQEEDRKKPPLY